MMNNLALVYVLAFGLLQLSILTSAQLMSRDAILAGKPKQTVSEY